MASSKRIASVAAHILPREVAPALDNTEIPPEGSQPLPQPDTSASNVGRRVGISFTAEDKLALPSRRRVRVKWHEPVSRVLLVKKWRNEKVKVTAGRIASWLTSQNIVVFVESGDISDYQGLQHIFPLDTAGERREAVDLVVSLGGDGTLLHASRLFRFLERCNNQLLPPCLVLGQGSLGFLATVDAVDWKPAIMSVLCGNEVPVPCTLRTRLQCHLECPSSSGSVQCSPSSWYALNECVVLTRGSAIGKLHVFVDGTFVTRVEGDGIIISSPTGSTGYSLSCGGPIVSPSVPCIMMTPIAPASLSFRPILISELSKIEILLPHGARTGEASVVLDGRTMGQLERGCKVKINLARPIPVLNVAGFDRDWLVAITNKLKWNIRDVEQADREF